MLTEDGNTIKGVFNHFLVVGEAKMTASNGDIFTGTFDEDYGIVDGVGTKVKNGKKYVGEFRNGKMHGTGKLGKEGVAFYEGDFIDGMRQGEGTMTYGTDYTYTGEWLNNKYDGQGLLEYDGYDYHGSFKQGLQQGKGHWKWLDQTELSGKWNKGMINGMSSYISRN